MQAGARLFVDVPPPRSRGRVIAAALAISAAAHVLGFEGLSRNAGVPRHTPASSIDVEIVEVPPPPPPPPVPEVLKEPEVAPRPRIVKARPPPEPEPPPPPSSEPPPQPEAKRPPIRVGISLQSTTEGGSIAVGTGNTLLGKADEVAGDPADARPYAASETKMAPFVPSSQVSSLPRVRREGPKIYPEEARRAGIEGPVVARLRIDEQGHVTSVKIMEGPGHGLNEAARESLLRFQFEPAKLGDRPVVTEISYTITFYLD